MLIGDMDLTKMSDVELNELLSEANKTYAEGNPILDDRTYDAIYEYAKQKYPYLPVFQRISWYR